LPNRVRHQPGPPPIRIPEGFLAIYHGNQKPTKPGEVGSYYGGAILLDAHDPTKILRRSPGPFFAPETEFEVSGFVPNVVFPTGMVQGEEKLQVYYGAADTVVGMVEFELRELVEGMIASD